MVGRLVLIASVAGILAGCTNPGAAYREDAAHTFKTNLVAETERVLAEAGGVMTLSNALELAHTRSLKLAQQDLETKLARINRATLFSAFLPTVGLSGNGLIAGGRVDDMPNLGDLKDNNLRVRSASLLVAQPFVILFTIPFSYLGIFAAIVAARQTLSIFGLLAGIMLVGVVVNAAILIIDAWRQTGDVKAAATSKFRPVLMSCVAALVGMLPMALGGGLGSELRQSMGIGSVGGIFVSTLVSLYFIPALCACLKSRSKG